MDFQYIKWILLVILLLLTSFSDANAATAIVKKAVTFFKGSHVPPYVADETRSLFITNLLKTTSNKLPENQVYTLRKSYLNNAGTLTPQYSWGNIPTYSNIDAKHSYLKRQDSYLKEKYSRLKLEYSHPSTKIIRATHRKVASTLDNEPVNNFKVSKVNSNKYSVEWSSSAKKYHKRELYELCKKMEAKKKGVADLKSYADLRKKMFEGETPEDEMRVLLEDVINTRLISSLRIKHFNINLEKDISGVKGFTLTLYSLCGYKVDYTTDKNQFTLSGNWIKVTLNIHSARNANNAKNPKTALHTR